jgi:hypothetical protein
VSGEPIHSFSRQGPITLKSFAVPASKGLQLCLRSEDLSAHHSYQLLHLPSFLSALFKMFSIRAFSRALPKSTFRPLSSSLRTLSTATRPSFLQSTWKPARIPAYSSFSTSSYRREATSDCELCLRMLTNLLLIASPQN